MKKLLFMLLILLGFSLTACANQAADLPPSSTSEEKEEKELKNTASTDVRIRLTVDGRSAVIRLYDNPASNHLLTLLPLTLTFEDYIGEEKISVLPRKLVTQGAERQGKIDDFAYFSPWGNIAVFYKGKHPEGNGLIILGTIESGKEIFGDLNSDFVGTLERME